MAVSLSKRNLMTPRADNQVAGLGSIAADFIHEVFKFISQPEHWLH